MPVPIDCVDGFTEAFYARPESFLDDRVRAAQSAWGFITPEATQRAVAHLRQDLTTGHWDQTYATWRTWPNFRAPCASSPATREAPLGRRRHG